MTDPSAPPTREEAMAAIEVFAEQDIHSDAADLMNDEVYMPAGQLRTLLTLARAGAEWMFASEETVEKIARLFAKSALDAAYRDAAMTVPSDLTVERYEEGVRNAVNLTWRDFIPEARAALAALSHQPEA